MGQPTTGMLRVGDWCVNPKSGQMSRNGVTVRLEERTIRLLLCLAQHAGEVVSLDDLLSQVWSGVAVTPDSVYQAVATLRRQLGDDPKKPTYIATAPRLGYRLVATVAPWAEQTAVQTNDAGTSGGVLQVLTEASPSTRRAIGGFAWATGGFLSVALAIALIFLGKIAPPPHRSIAVLPFLDLTEQMTEEPFADGITEELINRLSKIPGVRVPPPTSSFYFKGKQIPLAEIAKSLGVVYILDGSVRKSGTRVRVAARLIRAASGYVIWADTYDRPWDDILMIQDDIASEVTKALRVSIGKPVHK
jgi:transcriptional activator of cad operon